MYMCVFQNKTQDKLQANRFVVCVFFGYAVLVAGITKKIPREQTLMPQLVHDVKNSFVSLASQCMV